MIGSSNQKRRLHQITLQKTHIKSCSKWAWLFKNSFIFWSVFCENPLLGS